MRRHKLKFTDEQIAKMVTPEDLIKQIADNGGEASFKTVNGKIQDLHITVTHEQPSYDCLHFGCNDFEDEVGSI